MSQAFGGSTAAPLFIFGSPAQNQPATNQFATTPVPTAPFHFGPAPLASTTSTTATSNSAPIFTFGPRSNVFGASPASQPFIFGAATQNKSVQGPFDNPPLSKPPANFTTSNFTGGFTFGNNNNVPATQPVNPFGSNIPQTQPVNPFGSNTPQTQPVNPFGSNTPQTQPVNPFGSNTPQTQPANPFGSNIPQTQINFTQMSTKATSSNNTTMQPVSNGMFSGTTVNQSPWGNGTSLKPDGSVSLFKTALTGAFGTQNKLISTPMNKTVPNNTNLIDAKTSVAQPTNSVFTPTTATQIPGVTGNTNLGTSNFPNNTKPFVPFSTVFPANPVGNIFPQPTTAVSHGSTSATSTTNFSTIPVPVSTTITNTGNILGIAPTTALTGFTQSPMNNFKIHGATTTAQFNPNPLLITSLSETQQKPIVTSALSTTTSQEPKKTQNIEQSVPDMVKQFLTAVCVDPYNNRGKKDFSITDSAQVSAESSSISTVSTAVSTIPTTTVNNNSITTTPVTSLTPLPVTPVVQTNFRKGSSLHSSIDANFKLKPTSSSPSPSMLSDIIKSPVQQSNMAKEQLKSTFTDEEELILLNQRKTSKLSLSHVLNDSSVQSNPIHSLYPIKRLTDLENLIAKTPSPSSSFSSSTVTTKIEQHSHSSNENCDVSLNQFSPPSIVPQRLSSPIIQPKMNTDSQNFSLPILTRPCYYTKPTMKELESLFKNKSQSVLSQFTVGHEKYGSVTFYGRINVAGLNLDEIIEIKHHEVIVYPDDNNKPSVGEELNLPARITLFGVYPVDRSTHEEITDIERLKAMSYDQYLSKITEKFDGEFLNYGLHDGSWTFMVKHFTRYGLDVNQNEFVITSHTMDSNKTNLLYNESMKLNY